jgi:hypothetical protein
LSALVRLAQWKAVGVGERLCRASFARQTGDSPHLGIVLAAWDPEATVASVDLLRKWSRNMAGIETSTVVVANNESVMDELHGANCEFEVILGSNREAEFSAYEQGRQSLSVRTGARPDVWLILNDRLTFYGDECLWAITPPLLRLASSAPVAVGHLDFLPECFSLWGHRLKCYIRSNFVMVSAAAIESIGSICAVSSDEYEHHVPPGFPAEGWPLTEWLGGGLGEFLRSFLTEPDGWTRSEPLTPASWPRLRKKALSIVNEWLLNLRLIEAEVPLVPWRLARAMSCLGGSQPFSQRLLSQYATDPGFGGALEWSPQGRLQLAGAVLAGRAGATRVGDALLSYAAKSSAEARAS